MSKGMRVLICGDRHWTDYSFIFDILHALLKQGPIECVIEGEARGADTLGARAAEALGLPVLRFPADWRKYGRAAGPIRNREMLDEGKPTLVLAFHPDISKSKGTADMLRVAREAGVETRLFSGERLAVPYEMEASRRG